MSDVKDAVGERLGAVTIIVVCEIVTGEGLGGEEEARPSVGETVGISVADNSGAEGAYVSTAIDRCNCNCRCCCCRR